MSGRDWDEVTDVDLSVQHLLPEPRRGLDEVGRIVGAELDEMKAEFRDICWEADSRGMVGTFTCDGELYEIRVGKCSPELREELGL